MAYSPRAQEVYDRYRSDLTGRLNKVRWPTVQGELALFKSYGSSMERDVLRNDHLGTLAIDGEVLVIERTENDELLRPPRVGIVKKLASEAIGETDCAHVKMADGVTVVIPQEAPPGCIYDVYELVRRPEPPAS
jgi:hypothetical protein